MTLSLNTFIVLKVKFCVIYDVFMANMLSSEIIKFYMDDAKLHYFF